MREANFFTIFVGIESPDTDTLVSMQKKQNTCRTLADCVHKIYRAGMFVNAGFIVGFDSEKGAVADALIECIEATSIPFCMVGLLYALPTTQLTRRLAREGRLFPLSYTTRLAAEEGIGDQSTSGLNFETARPRRDILLDYRTILDRVYRPAAYYARVRTVARMLDRLALDSRSDRRQDCAAEGIGAFGQDSAEVLHNWLGTGASEIEDLRCDGINQADVSDPLCPGFVSTSEFFFTEDRRFESVSLQRLAARGQPLELLAVIMAVRSDVLRRAFQP
jgi:uncharacterized protein DUF4070